MQRVRRHDHSPRVEMTPLLDVVFLLLTFFIYSFVVMIRADALSVGLVPVTTGGAVGETVIQLLTIDGEGGFHFSGEPIGDAAIDTLLHDLATDPSAPTLYVSLAQDGSTDRGPVVWGLLQRIEKAGLENLVIVGPPEASVPPPEAFGAPSETSAPSSE